MVVNIAVSYSGRLEILKAVARIVDALEPGEISKADLNERLFAQYLDSPHLPFPDLFIRCGGLNRISNFILINTDAVICMAETKIKPFWISLS